MKYFKTKHPDIIYCKSHSGGAIGVIGKVGALLENQLIIAVDAVIPAHTDAWMFVDSLTGICSKEFETKRDCKAYVEERYF